MKSNSLFSKIHVTCSRVLCDFIRCSVSAAGLKKLYSIPHFKLLWKVRQKPVASTNLKKWHNCYYKAISTVLIKHRESFITQLLFLWGQGNLFCCHLTQQLKWSYYLHLSLHLWILWWAGLGGHSDCACGCASWNLSDMFPSLLSLKHKYGSFYFKLAFYPHFKHFVLKNTLSTSVQ